MSVTQKQNGSPVQPVKAEEAAASPLLDQILTEMNALASRQTRVAAVRLRTLEDIERFAEIAMNSGMVPKDYIGKRDMIVIAVQMGSELGLPPMQSLQNIAVVNGRPSVWGDALPGLCRASGVCRSIREWSEGTGDDLTYYCEAVRKDDPNPIIGSFSVAQARRAKLWQEKPTTIKHSRDGRTYEADSGVWYSYPERMLQMRARGFGLRDAFPDVLKGLITAEEAMDYPQDDAPALPPTSATGKLGSARERAIAGKITESQVDDIKALLKETNSDLQAFLAFAGESSIEEFSQENAQGALRMLERKKQRQERERAEAATSDSNTDTTTDGPENQEVIEQTDAADDDRFQVWLVDEQGFMDGNKAYTDPALFARTLRSAWEDSTDRENLLVHNQPGIADAERFGGLKVVAILAQMKERAT